MSGPSNMNNEMSETPLTALYFSDKNVEAVHAAIQYRIHQQQNVRIQKQSDNELRVIMRGMYFLHGQNRLDDVVGQVRELNNHAITFAVNQITTQIKQYKAFQIHQNELPTPMVLPKNMSIKGQNSLHTDNFI